jgi:hypothetical protein
MEKFNLQPLFQGLELVLKLQVFFRSNSDSVLEVFNAANVPINFDTLRDFTYEDASNRSLLKKNKCILMGVMVP